MKYLDQYELVSANPQNNLIFRTHREYLETTKARFTMIIYCISSSVFIFK